VCGNIQDIDLACLDSVVVISYMRPQNRAWNPDSRNT
jgi:hypothetical protein